jgi:O-antigen/teichoic acid export membrane protein
VQEERRALARGLVFVGVGTLLGNGAAYLLSMVAARVLSIEDFGAFGALLGLLVILSTLAISTQALTARRVSVAGAERPKVEGDAIRLSVYIGVVIIMLGLLAAWPVSALFQIPAPAVALGISSLAFVVFGSAAMGIAQGREAHGRLAAGFMANGIGRAIGGIIGVVVLGSIVGAAIGILIGCIVGALTSYLLICPGTWHGHLTRSGAIEFLHVLHALIVLFTLTNVDVLLARFFLPEFESGEYAVGVLLAKIAFFLPNAIIIVLFPKMAAGDSRRAVYIASALTAVLGLTVTLFSFGFGALVIRILGGPEYVDLLGSRAWLFALEGSAFALVQVLLYARLAAQDKRAVFTVWVGLITLVLTVSFWRNNSVEEIVTTVVFVSLALVVVGLFMDRRNNAPARPVVPIEAAE